MSQRVNIVGSLLAERIVVGLSAIVGVTSMPGQIGCVVKILSGSSLEIGGTYVLDGTGASTAFTWTKGYLIGTSEVLNLNNTGKFYLAATGATVTASVLRLITPGTGETSGN